MKRIVLILGFLSAALGLNSLELVFINKTDSPLFEVYAVPSDTGSWGYDKLPYDVILPGEYAVLDLDLDESKPANFRFIDEDGDIYLKYDVDISTRRKILISPEDHQALSQDGLIRFTLVNKTGSVIRALYITPETEEEWGDNLLDEYLLDSGEKSLELQSSGRSSFYDIRLETAGETIVNRRVYISDRARILLTLR